MFKPNRLIWRESSDAGSKWYHKGILKPLGGMASGVTSIAGKCFNRLGRGLGTMSAVPEATTSTLDEALKVGMLGTRNAVANIVAPFSVMKSDEAFLTKTKKAIGEIWHSSMKGTAKSAVVAIGDPLMTIAGVDVKKNRPAYRKSRGAFGLIDRFGLGALRAGTFFTGLDTPDPQRELIDADTEAVERLKRRDDWTKPRYLRGSKDGK